MNHFLQKIGAWYSPTLSEFIAWAPLRKQVELVLRTGGKEEQKPDYSYYPMEKDPQGYWRVRIPAALGTGYMFRLDGDQAYPDPASISQPTGVHGFSQLCDRNHFNWEDKAWQGLPLENMIIYELHTGTFSPTQDFEGIIQKLDYLLDLGVNTIELMPLAQFPGQRNWGYDGVFPFAVQDSYGGNEGFKKLVSAAHRKGMAIIVDVVYNHLGPEGNYLPAYGPYFTDKYCTPWGKAVNVDDAWSDGVRNFFLQNVTLWLEHFHVDGLRLDAVHAICDNSARPFIRQIKENAKEISEKTGCRKEIIAEMDLNDTKFIDPPEKGGYGLDGQWCDEFHHALHGLLTGEKEGYYEDFGEMGHLEKAFRDTYVYNGNYSTHRKRFFGKQVTGNPYSQFIVFAQNHDQVGNRAEGDRLTRSLSLEQLKLAAACVFLSPYIPLVFMGEEYGEQNPFLFFCSFSDQALIEAVRNGRKKEFNYPQDHFPDPQDQNTFNRSMLSWAYQQERGSDLFSFYKSLIAFRKKRAALQGISRECMVVHPVVDKTLSFERKILNDHLFVWLNFNDRPIRLPHEGKHRLKRIFDTAGNPENEVEAGGSICLSSFSAAVFEPKT